MEIKLITEKPHSETDILSYNPIVYQIGDLICQFNMLSFKAFNRFQRGIRLFITQSMGGLDTIPANELDKTELIDYYWEPGFGLPWFLMQFCEIKNKEILIPLLERHFKEHPKLIAGIPDDYDNQIFLRFLITDYLFYNLTTIQFIEMTKELIYLQSNIKKKVMDILGKNEESSEKVAPPRSLASRKAWESLQKKRSNLHLISQSLPSQTNTPIKTSAI